MKIEKLFKDGAALGIDGLKDTPIDAPLRENIYQCCIESLEASRKESNPEYLKVAFYLLLAMMQQEIENPAKRVKLEIIGYGYVNSIKK